MGADLTEAWVRHLRAERNVSANTVRAYAGDLAHLVDYLDRTGSGALADVDLRTLRRWLAGMHAAGAERATMQRRAAAARVFFAWAHSTGRLAADPATGLRSPRVDRRLPPTVEVDQARLMIEGLVERADAETDPVLRARAQRDVAIVEVLYAGGIRVGSSAAWTPRRWTPIVMRCGCTARATRNAPCRSAIRRCARWRPGARCVN